MQREDLEHIIRAAAALTKESDFIIIGSQAILGQYPDAPQALRVSMEADIYPRDRPELADQIDGSLGMDSPFDATFGYHADGVSPGTATLPNGWTRRLTPICNANTNGATGWCLEVHDLAIAKYAAGREKDLRYTAALLNAGYLDPATLDQRLRDTAIDHEVRNLIAARIRRDQARRRDSDRRPGDQDG